MTEIELIEKAVREVGIKSLLNHGAASCIYSEGCNGVTQDHLVALVRKIALHCAVALAAPSQPEGAEPVAWMMKWPNHSPSFTTDKSDYVSWFAGKASYPEGLAPLYLHPSQSAGAAAPDEGEVRERLRKFLDAAAGEGFVLGGVDAADLYVELFPAEYAAALSAPKGETATPSSQGGQGS